MKLSDFTERELADMGTFEKHVLIDDWEPQPRIVQRYFLFGITLQGEWRRGSQIVEEVHSWGGDCPDGFYRPNRWADRIAAESLTS